MFGLNTGPPGVMAAAYIHARDIAADGDGRAGQVRRTVWQDNANALLDQEWVAHRGDGAIEPGDVETIEGLMGRPAHSVNLHLKERREGGGGGQGPTGAAS